MSGKPMPTVARHRVPVVIGHGLMARAFVASDLPEDIVVFASGVSNSLETDPHQFHRERRLLEDTLHQRPQASLVYFGTCSVYDPDRVGTPYVRHKLEMESVLANAGAGHLILRLPLAIGPSAKARTLAHQLYARIRNGDPVDVWRRAIRYPIDIDDVVRITRSFIVEPPPQSKPINVALRAYTILEFVHIIETIVGRKATLRVVDKGGAYEVRCPELQARACDLRLDYGENYLEKVLRKYFKP